eukprot:TRINITY_DN1003_c0_g1_i3.p1 TRINITY_DN1003_c0_g1~~TRINITY_DN1003_c0_g1_i3.p1  ORF type:complete len:537 (-),score=104.15 TRINITY_DN1003_c0_g1_i3:334-1944(-)
MNTAIRAVLSRKGLASKSKSKESNRHKLNTFNLSSLRTAKESLVSFIKLITPTKTSNPFSDLTINQRLKLNLGLSIGNINTTSAPSLNLSHLAKDQTNIIRQKFGINPQSLGIIFSFTVADDVDPFTLGELSGSVKNILSMAKYQLDFTMKSKFTTESTGTRVYSLIFTINKPKTVNAIDHLAEHYSVRALEGTMTFSSKPGTRLSKEFIQIEAWLKVDICRDILNLLSLIPCVDTKPLVAGYNMLKALKEFTSSVAFDDLRDFYDKQSVFSARPDLQVVNWNMMRMLILQSGFLDALAMNDKLPLPLANCYRNAKIFLKGLHAAQFVTTDHTFAITAHEMDIFSLFPTLEELREKAVAAPPAKKTPKKKEIKVVVLGDDGVGKSALTVRFILNRFVEAYDPTIEDTFRKIVHIEGESVVLEILDTAGSSSALTDAYIRGADAFVFVYDITNFDSYASARQFCQHVQELRGVPFDSPAALVGNKTDRNAQRSVASYEGRDIAATFGTRCKFYEASAKTGAKCEAVFLQLAQSVWDA